MTLSRVTAQSDGIRFTVVSTHWDGMCLCDWCWASKFEISIVLSNYSDAQFSTKSKSGCVGAMVNTEILAQATRLGMRIHQVKVGHFPRRYGKQSGANLHVIIKAFRELCRLWRQLRHVAPDQRDSIPQLRKLRLAQC
jgi:hypothetical protein